MSNKLGRALALSASLLIGGAQVAAAGDDRAVDKPAASESGVKVDAPHARVEAGQADGRATVKVVAPHTNVRVDADRIRVRAPYVDIDIPRR